MAPNPESEYVSMRRTLLALASNLQRFRYGGRLDIVIFNQTYSMVRKQVITDLQTPLPVPTSSRNWIDCNINMQFWKNELEKDFGKYPGQVLPEPPSERPRNHTPRPNQTPRRDFSFKKSRLPQSLRQSLAGDSPSSPPPDYKADSPMQVDAKSLLMPGSGNVTLDVKVPGRYSVRCHREDSFGKFVGRNGAFAKSLGRMYRGNLIFQHRKADDGQNWVSVETRRVPYTETFSRDLKSAQRLLRAWGRYKGKGNVQDFAVDYIRHQNSASQHSAPYGNSHTICHTVRPETASGGKKTPREASPHLKSEPSPVYQGRIKNRRKLVKYEAEDDIEEGEIRQPTRCKLD